MTRMSAAPAEVEIVNRLDAVHSVLRALHQTTGLRLALVARVTEDSWTACAVLDEMGFGLQPGMQLPLETTY